MGYSPWGHKESDMTKRLNNKKHLELKCTQVKKWVNELLYASVMTAMKEAIKTLISKIYNDYGKDPNTM